MANTLSKARFLIRRQATEINDHQRNVANFRLDAGPEGGGFRRWHVHP